ncbi:MAG TPA: TadE/TadG family type IV pilus assembly protein [Pyrinomonadaceae bacterium]|nr:TadE/TadG family type IV pilus assembly protein [Pyrinomonadaceae bacterium]
MWQKLSRKITSFRRDDRGLQLVELAIAIPVLVLLFAAVAEFGRYFQTYTTLAKGSRVAARYLATARANGLDDLSAKNLVVYGNVAGAGTPIVNGLTVDNVSITRRNGAGAVTTGFPSTVTIEITNFKHTPIFDLGKLMNSSLSLNIDVKPSVTMRYLLTQSPI